MLDLAAVGSGVIVVAVVVAVGEGVENCLTEIGVGVVVEEFVNVEIVDGVLCVVTVGKVSMSIVTSPSFFSAKMTSVP